MAGVRAPGSWTGLGLALARATHPGPAVAVTVVGTLLADLSERTQQLRGYL